MFLLGFAAKLSLIFIWLASAVAGLLSGQQMAASFVTRALGSRPQSPNRWCSSPVCWILWLPACCCSNGAAAGPLALQLTLVLGYTAGLTLVMPGLWGRPLFGSIKNITILVLIMINAVLSDSR